MQMVMCVLMNGIVLFGEMGKDDSKELYIKQPVSVATLPPNQTRPQASIAFVPFLEYTEEFVTGVPIQRSQIMTYVTPVEELVRKYQSIFSPIILPPSPIV